MKSFNEAPAKTADMKVGQYSLHGDVIIEKISDVPGEFNAGTAEPKNALAYGEVTGHIHQLQGTPGMDFDLRVLADGNRYLKVFRPTLLKHQEHSPINLLPGNYKINIQREYDPFEKLSRKVID